MFRQNALVAAGAVAATAASPVEGGEVTSPTFSQFRVAWPASLQFKAKTIQKKGLVEFHLEGIEKEWIKTKEGVFFDEYYATRKPRTNKVLGDLITKKEVKDYRYELDAAIICDDKEIEQCCKDCQGAAVKVGCYLCRVDDSYNVSIPVLINMVKFHNNRNKDSQITLRLRVTKLQSPSEILAASCVWEASAAIPFDSQKRKMKSKIEKSLIEDQVPPESKFIGKWYANDLLGIDISGVNVDKTKLFKWLSEIGGDYLDERERVLLLVVGAFNPIHKGHKIMIDRAVGTVATQLPSSTVVGVYLYPLNDSDVSAKPSQQELILPTSHRIQNIEKTNFKPEHSIPLIAGPFDGVEEGNPLKIAELIQREVNEIDQTIRLLYVCGDTHFQRYQLYERDLCDGVVCVPKNSQGSQIVQRSLVGSTRPVYIAEVSEDQSYEAMSATKIQKKLKTDPRAIQGLLDEPVFKCMAQHLEQKYCTCERDSSKN